MASVFKNGGLIEEAAATIISNGKGQLALPSGLKFGNYQLIETKAPKGYLPNEEPYALNWNCNMDFEKDHIEKDHIITNRKIELGTFVQKTGDKIIETNGPFSYEFNTIRNASNVPLGSFTWQEKLPHEYISVEKMKTGTYFEPEGYELFLLSQDEGKIQIKNSLDDKDDQLSIGNNGFEYDQHFTDLNIGNLTEDIQDCLDGDIDYGFDGSSYSNIEAIEYALLETSRVTNFTTGVYNNAGLYDLVVETNKRKNIKVAENLDSSISHIFSSAVLSLAEDEFIKKYRVIFKIPASPGSFTSGYL
nr:prealbumin-like fold domain-containing protein [endosymbiont 'TC1' of Trimyema compressum]